MHKLHTTTSFLNCATLALLLTGCDTFNPPPVNFDQGDIVRLGAVHTIEIDGTVLSSLPAQAPPVDQAKAELGKLLFWDPILSGDRDVACATCHLPEKGYSDGLARSIGVGGVGRGDGRVAGPGGALPRNSQSIVNTVWNGIDELGLFDPEQAPMFWDNRNKSLPEQAMQPILDRREMRGELFDEDDIKTEVVARLNDIAAYRERFRQAYNEDISFPRIADAIAEFEKTLVANNSRFDRWMRGEIDAMDQQELSAMREFVRSGCADCHSGPLFSDFETHVLGIADAPGLQAPDDGDGTFAFRTPSLRQLNFTGPYFHNGRFATLAAAIDFYDDRDSSQNPQVPDSALDPELLDLAEMDDGRGAFIARFLMTLNDADFDQLQPQTVPSGLPPGGRLAD